MRRQRAVQLLAGAADAVRRRLVLTRLLCALLRSRPPAQAAAQVVRVDGVGTDLRRAEALRRSGAAAEAIEEYRRALAIDVSLTEAWFGLGTACHKAGDARRAHLYYRTALALQPRNADVRNELGLLELELGNGEQAELAFRDAVNADPGHPHAWNNLGLVVAARGETREALRCFRRAVSLQPDLYTALCNLGLACRQLELLEEGEQVLRQAAAAVPAAPEAWLNLGVVLLDAGRMDEALSALEQAHRAAPREAAVLTALADAHLRRGEAQASEHFLAAALDAAPNDPEARLTLAQLRLAQGDFARGWPLYEARLESRSSTLRRFPFPGHAGRHPAGCSVLVYGEQGLGDEIMFASMLPDLLRDARACRLTCDPRLRPLFARSFPQAQVLGESDAAQLPEGSVDFCLPVGSLGALYRPRGEAFPRHSGYLRAEPSRRAAWQDRLARIGQGPRIGLAWRGGLARTGRALRSIDPELLATLLRAAAVCWVGLQRQAPASELERLRAAAGGCWHQWDDTLQDLDESAALISALDLVVTVCSTTAHLSGALGCETWILTPFAPAWRYQLEGTSLPWYPAARLFRQPTPGDWPAVLEAVAAGLRRRLGAGE